MKFSIFALTLTAALPANVNAATSCFAGLSAFYLRYRGLCKYDALVAAIAEEVEKIDGCTNTAAVETQLLLGTYVDGATDADNTATATAAVRAQCEAAATADEAGYMKWEDIHNKGVQFDKNYFDGHSILNEEYETNVDNRVPYVKDQAANRLDFDGRVIEDVYSVVSEVGGIQYPDYMSNFQDCALRAVMCCWVSDRQANDNNGNCNKPYDTNCVDADPADNTDVCYVDMARSVGTGHVDAGFALYDGDDNNGEGATHCHGFAWGNDEIDPITKYKGNNLFYVSQYDHLYQRGYVRNVPGAPMCGCVEKMPTVSRSDCTQVDVVEVWRADIAAGSVSLSLDPEFGAEIEFNSCQGGRGNDLEAHYRRLVNQKKATDAEFQILKNNYIVGNGQCNNARARFVETMGFEVTA